MGFLVQLLVGTKEEGLVTAVVKLRNNDRATQSKSPLVVIQRCFFCRSCIEEIVRVKHRVFDVVVGNAVVLIRAGLAHQVHVHAEIGAILRRVIPALHLDFRDHVRAGAGRCNVAKVVHDADTVECQFVLGLALACSDEVYPWRIAGVVGLRPDDNIG